MSRAIEITARHMTRNGCDLASLIQDLETETHAEFDQDLAAGTTTWAR